MTTDRADAETVHDPAERWKARFRATRISLPQWARDAPDRSVFLSNSSGVFEVHAWDRATDERRQVTDRPEGTLGAALDPAGEWIWWFDDEDGNEFGVWRRQPWLGGPNESPTPGLEPSYPAGLALGGAGLAVIGRSTGIGTTVHVVRPDVPAALIYSHAEDASVVDIDRAETLVVIEHSERGDSRHRALRALRLPRESEDDEPVVVADLWDGPGLGLHGVAFSPVQGDNRLLALHERTGRRTPFLWDPVTGEQTALAIDLPGDLRADWYADGSAILVHHDHGVRSTLLRYDLATSTLDEIETPPGVVTSARARPDASIEYLWSSAAEPPAVRSTTGAPVPVLPGAAAPPSVPVEDLVVEGPDGAVTTLLSRPAGAPPYPTVFDIHGGPAAHDQDAFSPPVAAWIDAGYAVVRVNYRGSTGSGIAWRDAIEGRPGLVELEDIGAVRDAVVASGVADSDRLVLAGGSWGGYLTLLGLGLQPEHWSVGVAAAPVADFLAAYEDEMEPLKAYDRSLFGGSPDEVRSRYVASSPITYVERVTAPVLVLAGANDPRCPRRQIENYLSRLAELGKPHEVYRYDAGHGSLVVEERIAQMAAMLSFVDRHLLPGSH